MSGAALPALVFVGLAGLSAAFQSALAAGAPWGRWTGGGQHPGVLPAPQRAGAAVQSTLYLAMAVVMAAQGDLLDWAPPGWAIWATLAVTALAARAGVSRRYVTEAEAGRAKLGADAVSVAVTGIAGPGGHILCAGRPRVCCSDIFRSHES